MSMTVDQLGALAYLIVDRLVSDRTGLRDVVRTGRVSGFEVTETQQGAVILDLKLGPDDAVTIVIREERQLR